MRGVKADWLSSVRWKDISHVHFTDRVTLAAYRCIEEDNFDCKCRSRRDYKLASLAAFCRLLRESYSLLSTGAQRGFLFREYPLRTGIFWFSRLHLSSYFVHRKSNNAPWNRCEKKASLNSLAHLIQFSSWLSLSYLITRRFSRHVNGSHISRNLNFAILQTFWIDSHSNFSFFSKF